MALQFAMSSLLCGAESVAPAKGHPKGQGRAQDRPKRSIIGLVTKELLQTLVTPNGTMEPAKVETVLHGDVSPAGQDALGDPPILPEVTTGDTNTASTVGQLKSIKCDYSQLSYTRDIWTIWHQIMFTSTPFQTPTSPRPDHLLKRPLEHPKQISGTTYEGPLLHSNKAVCADTPLLTVPMPEANAAPCLNPSPWISVMALRSLVSRMNVIKYDPCLSPRFNPRSFKPTNDLSYYLSYLGRVTIIAALATMCIISCK